MEQEEMSQNSEAFSLEAYCAELDEIVAGVVPDYEVGDGPVIGG